MNNPTSKSIHVVLGAGGSRCIAYVGALRALAEMGYSFKSVSACSAGTIIGALVCAGLPLSKIEDIIVKTDLRRYEPKRHILSILRAFCRWPHAIYKSSPAPKIVCELLGSDPKLKDLPIPFATIGVDLVSNSYVVYSNETEGEMHISEAVSIATAIPFAYPPHQKDGRIVVDAAIATQCPIWLAALQKTASPIYALTCQCERNVETPQSFGDYLGRIITAGAESGDETIYAIMPRLHHIEIPCPKMDSLGFAPSAEGKRALLNAGEKSIKRANLQQPTLALSKQQGDEASPVKTIINKYYREVIMNNNLVVGGNAIINIDSVLKNVQQTLQQSEGLATEKKDEFQKLFIELREELDKIQKDFAQEAALITQRLHEIVQLISQPVEQRNVGVLKVSAKGLVDAAETVGEIVPKLLTTAGLIAKFVTGL